MLCCFTTKGTKSAKESEGETLVSINHSQDDKSVNLNVTADHVFGKSNSTFVTFVVTFCHFGCAASPRLSPTLDVRQL